MEDKNGHEQTSILDVKALLTFALMLTTCPTLDTDRGLIFAINTVQWLQCKHVCRLSLFLRTQSTHTYIKKTTTKLV